MRGKDLCLALWLLASLVVVPILFCRWNKARKAFWEARKREQAIYEQAAAKKGP